MVITSSALQANNQILPQYTCEGANISPPLTFSEIPNDAQSLALIMDDPDAPSGTFTHWVLYDMSPGTLVIVENEMPQTGTAGANSFGKLGYSGPCPPSGTHRYFFTLFALDMVLDLPEGQSKQELEQAMNGHVLDTAELMGMYTKNTQ